MALKLKTVREERGMSRAAVARAAGINAATYSQIELGRFFPYPVQIHKIADALGWTRDPLTLLQPE